MSRDPASECGNSTDEKTRPDVRVVCICPIEVASEDQMSRPFIVIVSSQRSRSLIHTVGVGRVAIGSDASGRVVPGGWEVVGGVPSDEVR